MPTTEGKVKFIQYHQPALESGEYNIKVEQTIKSNARNSIPEKTYNRELIFSVIGERFEPLTPQEVYGIFPPNESLGDHSNVLPHITVKRSTLPWERYPGTTDENRTWLALLLFRDSDFAEKDDKPKLKTITLGELIEGNTDSKFPTYVLDGVGQTPDEQTTVFDIKKKYVADILPTREDLDYISHVRKAETNEVNRTADNDESDDNEFATIICNRLPEPNGTSYVHLVSIEGRFGENGNFDFMGADDEDKIRFVSLANWSFSCIDPKQTFTELLLKLNRTPCAPRLPNHADNEAEEYLAMGYIPLPHSLRQGSQTVSWYRSPLGTGFNAETYEFPVKAADELLRYDSNLGMFDASYAAAWQLGRMLTLQNRGLATDFYNWKRANAQRLAQLGNFLINSHFNPHWNVAPLDIPQNVLDWFKALELLQGVPFNYLVPDEKLLPPESIRFFWVDSLWVDCLQDGAFSIGRVTGADVQEDGATRSRTPGLMRNVDQKITGIIMRSQVVAGWPGLLVDGYDQIVSSSPVVEDLDNDKMLPQIRMEKLAKDVLICLFQGDVKTVEVHQKPEAMHFGVDPFGVDDKSVTKDLRNAEGELITGSQILLPWHNEGKRVINLTQFAQNMFTWFNDATGGGGSLSSFTSAQFGLQMIEGVQKVRFFKNE